MAQDDWIMGATAAQDAYRPLGNDPWTGLMRGQSDLPLGGVAAPRDETVAFRTASPQVNITEGDISRATEAAMAVSGGGLTFGGRLSKTADLEALARAEKMHTEGTAANDVWGKFDVPSTITNPLLAKKIWDETGWFRAADGQWRYQIPDAPSKWKIQPSDLHSPSMLQQTGRSHADPIAFSEAYDHPELFKAYPQLANADFNAGNLGAGVKGAYVPGNAPLGIEPQIMVNPSAGAADARSTILHETQHGIQQIEGFAGGGNPKAIKPDVAGTPAWSVYQDTLKKLSTPYSVKEFKAKGMESLFGNYDKYIKKHAESMANGEIDRYAKSVAQQQTYERIAGEVEARNVQTRRDFDPTQLRQLPLETQAFPNERQLIPDKMGGLFEPQLSRERDPNLWSPQEEATQVIPKLRAKAEALFGKYPQYAEQYPSIGPPNLREKVFDAKGKPIAGKAGPIAPYGTMEEALTRGEEPGLFLQKQLTPEAERFQKDRAVIQQDMDVHGYEPYFDPTKRFDVDPAHYGPFADTAIEAAPKTAKTRGEWEAKYGSEEARARLQEAFQKGTTISDSERWYHMGQLEKAYIDELGPKAGREAFKREFADMMAATTGGASPYENFMMSQYANVMAKRGQRMPERAFDLPFPIGGRYASGNIEQAQKYIDEGMKGFNPAQNPKRYDFSSAYQGNPLAGTIDEQMMNLIEPGTSIPQWYGPATKTLREEAAKAGVDTRGFQDVGWAGAKANKEAARGNLFQYEGPMINHINRSIETTHRLTGIPREEIVKRGLIRKEIPMYGLAGAAPAGMGALAAQDQYTGD